MENFLITKFLNKKIVEIPMIEIRTIENEAIEEFDCGFELIFKNKKVVYKSHFAEHETFIITGTKNKTVFTKVEKKVKIPNGHYFLINDNKYTEKKELVKHENYYYKIAELETVDEIDDYLKMQNKIFDTELFGEHPKHALAAGDIVLTTFFSQYKKEIAKIEPEEFEAMKYTYGQGVIYYDKTLNVKNMKAYDCNSYYGFLQSNFCPIPISAPKNVTKEQLKDLDITEIYGYYNVDVKDHLKYVPKSQKMRKENKCFMTNFDILLMKENNIQFELKDDGHIIFEQVKDFSDVFKKIINIVYPLKQKRKYKKFAKDIILQLWGKLCERDRKYYTYEEFDDIDSNTVDFSYTTNGKVHVKGGYIYPFARMKPFLLSLGRYRMWKHIQKIENLGYHVARSYCDSITTDIPEDKFNDCICEISKDIGDYKIETKKVYYNNDYYITPSQLLSERPDKTKVIKKQEEPKNIIEKEKHPCKKYKHFIVPADEKEKTQGDKFQFFHLNCLKKK